MPLRILFVPFGSEGDINPLLWLALLMAERGHCPVFLLNPHYGHLAETHGFEWYPAGSEEDFLRLAKDPSLWKPGTGSWRVAQAMHESLPVYKNSFEASGGNYDLVVTSTFALAASALAETRRIPRLMLHLQPICLRSHGDFPVFGEGMAWLQRLPRSVRNLFFLLVDAILDRTMLPPLNSFRSGLGLSALKNFYKDAMMTAEGLALLVPDWFAPAQSDWPQGLRPFDFPLVEKRPQPLPGEVLGWLEAGEPPVLWTHGSANFHLEKFQRLALAVTERIGGRALLVGKTPPGFALPQNLFYFPHLPFGDLLPHCRAIVHHGGIGTTSKSFAAGIPQLVLPLAHDQHDNAARVVRLKAGLQSKPEPCPVAEKLALILHSAEIRTGVSKCRDLAKQSPARSAALASWAEELAQLKPQHNAPQTTNPAC